MMSQLPQGGAHSVKFYQIKKHLLTPREGAYSEVNSLSLAALDSSLEEGAKIKELGTSFL